MCDAVTFRNGTSGKYREFSSLESGCYFLEQHGSFLTDSSGTARSNPAINLIVNPTLH